MVLVIVGTPALTTQQAQPPAWCIATHEIHGWHLLLSVQVGRICFAARGGAQLMNEAAPVGGQGAYPGIRLQRQLQVQQAPHELVAGPHLRWHDR